MLNVQEAVSNLRDQLHKRNSKIQGKIEELRTEASKVESKINNLMQELIQYDMDDDLKGQDKTNKELGLLRARYEDLVSRIQAYEDGRGDTGFIRTELAKIFDIAITLQEQRVKELEAKTAEMDQILEDIKNLQKKIKDIDTENLILRNGQNRDQREITSLLKYIEPRQIAIGKEIRYLEAFANGESKEMLEQYLEKPKVPWQPPEQVFEYAKETHTKECLNQTPKPVVHRNLLVSEVHNV